MIIVVISDHLEYQKKTSSIKWVYSILKSSQHSVHYVSTGLSLMRLTLKRIKFKDFLKNIRFSQKSKLTFLFPVFPILNRFTRKYFQTLWTKGFVRNVVNSNPDLIIVESGIPTIVLYSIFHNDKLKGVRKVYRVSDIMESFRKNPVLSDIERFIINNRRVNNCIVSAPAYHSSIAPDQILTPGVPLFALEKKRPVREKNIVYIGIYPLPEDFIDQLSNYYKDYKIICTSVGRSKWRNVEFVGIVGQKVIQEIVVKASIGVMFFPSGASDWFLSSSNKLSIYNALGIPVISNDCGVNLEEYCIYNIGKKIDPSRPCKQREVHSWEQFTEKLIGC